MLVQLKISNKCIKRKRSCCWIYLGILCTMKWISLLPHLQIFQQGKLCTLIVQVDPNMFLCRNLCMKIRLFVEQHRHTVRSYKHHIQCSPRHFDKILEDNFCKWPIQWTHRVNHQIYRQRRICCGNVEENKKKISGCLSAIDFQEKNLPIRLLGDVVVFAKRTIHAVVEEK